jgi:predicted small metal-binding protein
LGRLTPRKVLILDKYGILLLLLIGGGKGCASFDEGGIMGKSLKCKDVGITDCTWEAKAETEEELIEMAKAHGPVHGITEISAEMMEQIKAAIKND